MSDDDTQRVTPEAVAAFQAGDRREVSRLLQLKPWETNPLDADVDAPPWRSDGTTRALMWSQAVALRKALESVAHKKDWLGAAR
jgi:hypothetical protein